MEKQHEIINPKKPYLFPIIDGKWNGQILQNSSFCRNQILFFWQQHDRHYQKKKPTSVKFQEQSSTHYER